MVQSKAVEAIGVVKGWEKGWALVWEEEEAAAKHLAVQYLCVPREIRVAKRHRVLSRACGLGRCEGWLPSTRYATPVSFLSAVASFSRKPLRYRMGDWLRAVVRNGKSYGQTR